MNRLKEIEQEIALLNLEKQELMEKIKEEPSEREVEISAWFFANIKIKATLDLRKDKEEIIADAYRALEEIISTELSDDDLELKLTIDGMTNINRNIDEIEIIISDEDDNILVEGDFKEE